MVVSRNSAKQGLQQQDGCLVVWSFGTFILIAWCTLIYFNLFEVYEIYAEGGKPYSGLTNVQARAKVVAENYRMEMPKVILLILCVLNNPMIQLPFRRLRQQSPSLFMSHGRRIQVC